MCAALDENEVPREPGVPYRTPALEELRGAVVEALRESHSDRVAGDVYGVAAQTLECDMLSAQFASQVLDRAYQGWTPQLGYALIRTYLRTENFSSAHALAERCAEVSPFPSMGWRCIGEFFAERADAEEVFALWPKYEATRDRNGIDRIRATLLRETARCHGWRAAAELASHSRMGSKAGYSDRLKVALRHYAEQGDPLALRELIASEAVLSGVEPVDRMHLLILAIRASDRGVVGQDHELLPGVIDEIISLDPLESKQLSRTRDWLLVECWPAIEEQATLDRVRGAVRAPMWKRELKTLKHAE